jgi:hypothetical protein
MEVECAQRFVLETGTRRARAHCLERLMLLSELMREHGLIRDLLPLLWADAHRDIGANRAVVRVDVLETLLSSRTLRSAPLHTKWSGPSVFAPDQLRAMMCYGVLPTTAVERLFVVAYERDLGNNVATHFALMSMIFLADRWLITGAETLKSVSCELGMFVADHVAACRSSVPALAGALPVVVSFFADCSQIEKMERVMGERGITASIQRGQRITHDRATDSILTMQRLAATGSLCFNVPFVGDPSGMEQCEILVALESLRHPSNLTKPRRVYEIIRCDWQARLITEPLLYDV